MSRGPSAYGSGGGGGSSWDDGPPGAESDYSHTHYPAPPGYGYGSGPSYAGYEQHYAAAYSTAYPEAASSRYPPPPPPRDRYSAHHIQRKRRTRSKSPLESRHYDRRRRRSRSSSSSAERVQRTRSRDRRGRGRRSPDSSPSSATSHSDREHRRKSPAPSRRRSDPSPPHRTATSRRSPRQRAPKLKRARQDSANSNSRPVRHHSPAVPQERSSPLRRRDRSITPPKSYKTRDRTSSSSSASSSRSESSRSRSASHSDHSQYSSSRSGTRSRSRSRHRDASPVEVDRDRPRSGSGSRERSNSDSSSRGHFSGYDRKRYFRKLKEQRAKECEIATEACTAENEQKKAVEGHSVGEETCEKVPTATEPSDEADSVRYGEPPPVDGVNFEDLPPPPEELFSRPRRTGASVCIRNDGSFLEMFKRLQEESKRAEEAVREATTAPEPPRKPALPFIGKRRGGRVLKTGVVKKVKAAPETSEALPKDAWSLYMQEVKKYRETSCEEERKTRPLVK